MYLIMKNILSKVYFHPLFILSTFIFILIGRFRFVCYFMLLIIVHELGHIFVSKLFKWKLDRIIVLPLGGIVLYDIKLNRKVPGPGAYNIRKNSTSGPMYGFSRQKRGFFTINDNPGPGSYHIPCSFEELNTYTRRMGNFNEEFRYI